MGAEAAVLLPVRLETRFDEADGFAGMRLRVLVVPDVCWFDRTQEATAAELELLANARTDADGPLAAGTPSSPKTAAAFEALARQVGPGRALWLSRLTDPPAAPRASPARATRIRDLPGELALYAVLGDDLDANVQPVQLGMSQTMSFEIRPSTEEHPGGWWPSWKDLERAGLTFTVDLGATAIGAIDPDDIAALFVTGLGKAEAGDVLRRHLDVGDLGLAQPGTPTNTVAGSRAVDLGRDPATWRALGERAANREEAALSQALTGDRSTLGPLVGSSDGRCDRAAGLLIDVLWPAMASNVLAEVWQVKPDSLPGLGGWAAANLRPDGPLPVLRLGEQPYGVWPVSDWPRWDLADLADETGLPIQVVLQDGMAGPEDGLPTLAAMRDAMAERARTGLGTVAGATTDRLWDVLSQTPTSAAYEVRPAVHIETLRRFLSAPGQVALQTWWDGVLGVASEAMGAVRPNPPAPIEQHIVTVAGPIPLDLGVVLPPIAVGPRNDPLFLPWIDVDPDEARRLVEEQPERWLELMCRGMLRLFTERGVDPDVWEPVSNRLDLWPGSLLWRLAMISGFVMVDHAVRNMQEAFPPSQYRPDAAIAERVMLGLTVPGGGGFGSLVLNGYLTFRAGLQQLADLAAKASPKSFIDDVDRLVRGLLDTSSHRVDPWLTGAAWRRLRSLDGSRPIGLYGWVDRPHTGDPGPDTETGILLAPSDAQVRTSVILRDRRRSDPDDRWQMDLSSGGVRDASRLSDDIRSGAHPAEALGREVERVVGDRGKVDRLRATFPVRTEHVGRRTCDGLAVVEAAVSDPAHPDLLGAGLDAADISRVARLATTLDAFADLLVAGAVHNALAGRSEAAGEYLEAAAGLGLPPPLDVIATPGTGRSVRTTVLAGLLDAGPAGPATSPAARAAPQVAAWLGQAVGPADGPSWTWRVTDAAGSRDVTLEALGLEPIDAVVINPVILDRRAAAHASATPSEATVTAPAGPAEARRLVSLLGERPLVAADLGLVGEAADAFEAAARTELEARTVALADAAAALADRLHGATADADPTDALDAVSRWGLAPAATDARVRADEAGLALTQRLQRLPADRSNLDLRQRAAALADLVAPEAKLPIPLSTTRAALEAQIGPLEVEPVEVDGRPHLDGAWLELVAAVRPPMSRIEAHQIAAATLERPTFRAASNRPGDPWLATVEPPAIGEPSPHGVFIYGPEIFPAAGKLAVTLLDSWAEVIPDTDRRAAAAFRFNAPAAKAPQAVLVAVTPVRGQAVDADMVLRAVMEARKTAQARTARPEDLGNLDLFLGGVLPAFERGGFQFASPANPDHWP